jgi:hypothetical protein
MSVDSYIQVPPDGSGKKIRAIQETNLSGDIVYSKVVKVSGETVKISGEVVKTTFDFGYEKGVVSGAVICNIVSGQVVLHTVILNRYTSGLALRVWDSCSGAAGTLISESYAGTALWVPSTLIFDCVMYSGIVVTTSGATWYATVTYKKN